MNHLLFYYFFNGGKKKPFVVAYYSEVMCNTVRGKFDYRGGNKYLLGGRIIDVKTTTEVK